MKERVLKAKGNPCLDKVADINVICGVLSNFLKSLREPILTFNMQPIFIKASGEGGREGWKGGWGGGDGGGSEGSVLSYRIFPQSVRQMRIVWPPSSRL